MQYQCNHRNLAANLPISGGRNHSLEGVNCFTARGSLRLFVEPPLPSSVCWSHLYVTFGGFSEPYAQDSCWTILSSVRA